MNTTLRRKLASLWLTLRSFERAAALILGARVAQNLNGFLLSVIVVRKFGLAGAGTLAIATAPTVVLSILCSFGLPYMFARMKTSDATRNTVALAACLAAVVVAAPISALTGLAMGRDKSEAATIALLAMGGAFFAQTNVMFALLVQQGQEKRLILAPGGNLVGLVAGFAFQQTFVGFSLVVCICRFVGLFALFRGLRLVRISLRDIGHHIWAGTRFLTADLINMSADQLTVLACSYLLSREDLGILGLCRQLLTVSDTPGWSRLMVWYPRVVADPKGTFPPLVRKMLSLGTACALVTAVFSVALGFLIYRQPQVALFAPLLLSSGPLRYLVVLYDMGLRATGAISANNMVTLLRGGLVLPLVGGGAAVGGISGAILAMVFHVAIAAWVTAPILRRHLAKGETVAPQLPDLRAVSP